MSDAYVHLISDTRVLSVRVTFTFTKMRSEHDIFTFKL